MSDKREKVRLFLEKKITELEHEIKSRKRKNLLVKIVHGTLVFVSITSAFTVCTIAPLAVPGLVLSIVAGSSAVSTALSLKFDIKNKKHKLSRAIKSLNSIRNRLDYVVHCNGDLDESECSAIMKEFSDA